MPVEDALARAAAYAVHATEVSSLKSQVSRLQALVEKLRGEAYGPFLEERPIAILSAFGGLGYLVEEISTSGNWGILEVEP